MLKIVTYNIQHGLKLQEIKNNLHLLSKQGVDIFCLQEIRRSFMNELLAVLGQGWKHESFFAPDDGFDYNVCMIWKSSELEATGFNAIPLPKLDKLRGWQCLFEQVMRHDPTPIHRGALSGIFKKADKYFRITTIHFDWSGGMPHRACQARHLADQLVSENFSGSEVVCGDGNTIGLFPERSTSEIQTALGADFVNALPHFPATSTSTQSLDKIFVKGMTVLDARVLKLKGSDHFPVMASLKV